MDAVSLQLGELCRRIGVPYRHARYILEQGILPTGVEVNPGWGNHRTLDAAQAFWLAIVLKLKENGVTAPSARKIADFAREGMSVFTRRLPTWDPE
ncbi:MAG TPA: MerR family transcriptional regulator, partial [Gemmataceae bacterium]|nr:MerR family transcriptional regulator [Gemmataceae bacterium]